MAFSFMDGTSPLLETTPASSISPAAAATPTKEIARGDEVDISSLMRIAKAMAAVGDITYHWIIETDQIKWSPNVEAVLGCRLATIATGRAYANLLDSDNITSRYDTVMRSSVADQGDGVSFQIEYQLRPQGRDSRKAIWVEDHGRWYGDKNGRPIEVFGTLRRIDDRHIRDQHLSFLGNCDPLTGMMNRGRLSEALNETIAMATQEHSSCAFLIAAVNNMYIVNEAYGFEVADEVIVAMGRRLRQVVRTGDAIARYSGSKFGVILNNCSEQDLSVAVNRFINLARESVIETEHGPVWAMLSIGAVIMPRHAADANLAMARAEEALTEARRLPSDGSVLYKPSAERAKVRSMNARYATEIVTCLKEDHFKLAFQPIVSSKTHEVYMHEALLRMQGSDSQLIAAAHLIPVAEKLGLVRLIDRSVAHLTIATLHAHPQARLSMNVSGATATDPRWFHQLVDIIRANSEVADRLTIEITETVALGNMKEAFAFVEALRNIGCSVAIDDFGAGFTSFRNLRDLPVNIIKLDGSFCLDLAQNKANQYLLRTLSDLGHKFGLKVIAEWVEKEADLAVLEDFNVDFLQGNFFGAATTSLPWPRRAEEEGSPFNLHEAKRYEPVRLDLEMLATELSPSLAVPAAADIPAPTETAFVFTEGADHEPRNWHHERDEMSRAATWPPFEEAVPDVTTQPLAETTVEPTLETAAQTAAPAYSYEPDLEEGLSKLRLAIQALDQHIRNQAGFDPELDSESEPRKEAVS